MMAHGCGTPAYSAPEAFMPNAKLTPASDIYSLGITGIELITGSTKRESIKDIWINNDVTQLLWEMTSWTPSARPDAATVVSRITNITQTYNKNFNTVVGAGIVGVLGWLLFKGN
jgi:serine/threonine protein kinase